MPHISVMLYPGRSPEAKLEMAEKLRSCLMETAGWKAGDISVSFEEIEAAHFAEEVHKKVREEDLVLTSDYIK